ncbi:MAG: CorA family divalent cation transporter, partial [Gammaproteobacteria bacterium]
TPLVHHAIKHMGHFTTKTFLLDNAHLFYLLLDMIIDEHLIIVEQKGDVLESLEERIIKKHEDIESDNLYLLKRDMLHLRKNIMGLRNIVNTLLHEHDSILPQLPAIYLRDLQDHVLIILESIDIHRELSKNILEVYMSVVNTKLNETMKVLAVFAAIFIPLTFITGFYGMNFNIPELHWKYGYFFAVGLILSVSGGLLYWFRKKGWI